MKALEKKLQERKQSGQLRRLEVYPKSVDFFSNDYLGFAQLSVTSSTTGSSGSRLISGNSRSLVDFEKFAADFFMDTSALLFPSGYMANLGLFSSIPQRGDIVLYDEEIHASIIDGLRLSFSQRKKFTHNDVLDLERKLQEGSTGTVYIAIESLYSMSGQLAPLDEILEMAEKYNAFVIVDEAHAAGIFGEQRRGLTYTKAHPHLFARVITFGKAYGWHGAVVLSSELVKEYLINFCRPFIYTTAPEASFADILLERLSTPSFQAFDQLSRNVQHFRSLTSDWPIASDPSSPIQMLPIGDTESLQRVAQNCLEKGMLVKAIFPPTVAPNSQGLRLSLHSFNSPRDIDSLVTILREGLKE